MAPTRRRLLSALPCTFFTLAVIPPSIAKIQPELSPIQSLYDPSDEKLRRAGQLIQSALNAPTVEQEERLWTQIITEFSGIDDSTPWKLDVVGRATGNRGNARARQGLIKEAISDYTRASELCPWSVDPILNRGVAYEALGQFDDAISDYQAVLEVQPGDPSANNNIGNAYAGKGDWAQAEKYYLRAAQLAPQFSFAAANRALALFQLGKNDTVAIKEMRSLLRKYSDFDDMRAALAAALWIQGREDLAENEWIRVEDQRYKDMEWIKKERRWPPRLQEGLSALLELRTATKQL